MRGMAFNMASPSKLTNRRINRILLIVELREGHEELVKALANSSGLEASNKAGDLRCALCKAQSKAITHE